MSGGKEGAALQAAVTAGIGDGSGVTSKWTVELRQLYLTECDKFKDDCTGLNCSTLGGGLAIGPCIDALEDGIGPLQAAHCNKQPDLFPMRMTEEKGRMDGCWRTAGLECMIMISRK